MAKPGPNPVPKAILAARGSWRANRPSPVPPVVVSTAPPPPPPRHLSAAMKRWWRSVVSVYTFNDSEYVLLRHACESYDLAEQARRTLHTEGLTVRDPKGQTKAHPAVAIARDARAAYARLVKQLDLES